MSTTMECGHNARYEIREEIPDPEHHPIGDVAVARYCAICAIDNYKQAEKHIEDLEARMTNAEEWGRRVSDYAGELAVSHSLVMRSAVGEIEGVLIALHERLEQVERERATARAQVQALREALNGHRVLDETYALTASEAVADRLRAACERAEQTLRNLGVGSLSGDNRTIALNEASNLRDALKQAEPKP